MATKTRWQRRKAAELMRKGGVAKNPQVKNKITRRQRVSTAARKAQELSLLERWREVPEFDGSVASREFENRVDEAAHLDKVMKEGGVLISSGW